ncbi:MAG: nucleotide exchange factor GrpE [Treponema sp.]|nr:nucleotide exchange factor GrpE [Treponema sp.]
MSKFSMDHELKMGMSAKMGINIENDLSGAEEAGKTPESEVKEKNNEAEAAQNQADNNEGPPVEQTPEEVIAGLEEKLADITDQLLRKAADFENFRKRMNQEKQSAIEFANQSLLLDIITIIDDFERAIQSAEGAKDFTGFLDGVKMIEKRLVGQLESKWGLKRFNSVGEPFDPNIHEALMVEKSPDAAEAVVSEDLIRGYLLKDRLLRAAKVKVTMPEEQGGNE